MTGAQYITESLIRRGVTDTFGIPGGVVLRLLYAFDERREELEPHLSYHEQCAGFAACGYAQASGRLGVAYATRGPGFTNLITAMADAYYDSLPTLFITAHSKPCPPEGMRVMADQETDTCSMVRNITKKAVRMDDMASFAADFEELCDTALSGRKGPVFADIATAILSQEIPTGTVAREKTAACHGIDTSAIVNCIREARRPVILVGDGINQAGARELFNALSRKCGIPVISSRFTHDIMEDKRLYYGYLGSHGMRCANYILSKTDLIVSLGNRLHFPPDSESFGDIPRRAHIIRCDIDGSEFAREIPNATAVNADVRDVMSALCCEDDFGNHEKWVAVCDRIREELKDTDVNMATEAIADILRGIPADHSISNDVGNNEFWVSRACVRNGIGNRVYYSKSFAAIGCGLGKAIGIHYATRKPVVLFVGDQGLQVNIQELQYIAQNGLPIMTVVVNNHSSGMIKDYEKALFGKYVHTTRDSGFYSPSFRDIAAAYGMEYACHRDGISVEYPVTKPLLMEIGIDEDICLTPNLPKGNKCQDMTPRLPKEKHEGLNRL